MKKFLFIPVVLCFFLTNAMAQFEVGKTIIGGSSALSFASVSTKYKSGGLSADAEKISNFNFSPTVGFFAADNFALGLSLQYESSKQGEFSSNTFLAGPFARYYFDVNSPNVFPFLTGEIGFGTTKTSAFDEDMTLNTTAIGISGGIAVLVSENISLDFGLGYASITNKMKNISDVKQTGGGVALSVGFNFLF